MFNGARDGKAHDLTRNPAVGTRPTGDRRRRRHTGGLRRYAVWVATAVAGVGGVMLAPVSPALAAARTIVQSTSKLCLRESNGPASITLRVCSTKPVANSQWIVINRGPYNRHPLWQFQDVATKKCIVAAGITGPGGGALAASCRNNNDQRWEVFYTGSGSARKMVLKSFGAFTDYRQHLCLQYLAKDALGTPSVYLNGCDIKNTAQQFNP